MALLTIKMSNKLELLKEFNIERKIKELLNRDYLKIAKNIYKSNNCFFIGRNIDYALCMEASLKMKEISYIHSEAYAAGELKHGTISLIGDNTPVFGICTNDEIRDKTISNIKEVKARGAYIIFITNKDINDNFYNEKIVIPKVHEIVSPILTVIPLQLIAYYTAKLSNCDIDKPRNLAKSVTVE